METAVLWKIAQRYDSRQSNAETMSIRYSFYAGRQLGGGTAVYIYMYCACMQGWWREIVKAQPSCTYRGACSGRELAVA